MGERVDGDGDREDQHGVDVVVDLDAVGVAHAEPLLRDLGDLVAVALDLVLVIDDVAVDLQVLAVVDLDVEAVADADQRLLDRGLAAAVELDLDRVADASFFSRIVGDLVAVARPRAPTCRGCASPCR